MKTYDNIIYQITPPILVEAYLRVKEVYVKKVVYNWSPLHAWYAKMLHRYLMSKGVDKWQEVVYNDQQWIRPQSRYYIHNSSMPDTKFEDGDMCQMIMKNARKGEGRWLTKKWMRRSIIENVHLHNIIKLNLLENLENCYEE